MCARACVVGLGQLRRLDLSNNGLAALPDGALRHSPSIQRVVLDNNRLTTLRQCSLATGAFAVPPYLRTLSLLGNPLYCDCRLAWLLSVSRSTTVDVWWAACRGGLDDNQTDVIRHHSYYALTQSGVCAAASTTLHDCPFNI